MSFMRRRNVILQNICMRWDFPGVRQGTRGVDSSFTSRHAVGRENMHPLSGRVQTEERVERTQIIASTLAAYLTD